MKILHVGAKSFPPDHGGVERIVYDIASGMQQVESHVLTEWKPVRTQKNVMALDKGFFPVVRQIKRYCKDNAIDIVHFHKEAFIPHALILQAFGVTCLVTIHGCGWRLSRWGLHYRIVLFILDFLACIAVRRVVFVGLRDVQFFRRLLFCSHRIVHVSNGVRIPLTSKVSKVNRMVYLGRLSPEKNIISLIKASERERVELDLYGPFDRHKPSYKSDILKLLDTCQYVRLKGSVPYGRVPEILSNYNMLVNPSFSEGMPVSVLEGAACGLRLILSDIPQHRLLNFPSCSYVDPRNIEFRKVLNHDSGELNRTYASRNFSVTAMVNNYLKIYEQLLYER